MRDEDRAPPSRRRLFRLDLGPHRVERDVDAELAFHLDMRVRRLVERGMTPLQPEPRRSASSATGTSFAPRCSTSTTSRRRP